MHVMKVDNVLPMPALLNGVAGKRIRVRYNLKHDIIRHRALSAHPLTAARIARLAFTRLHEKHLK